MKHLKTFESFQINEEIFNSHVYKYLQNDRKELIKTLDFKSKSMSTIKFVYDLLASTIFREPDEPVGVIPKPTVKSYIDIETKEAIDLSDLTEDDYKKAVEMGKSNKWGDPSGNFVGVKPKFFKEADEKTKKAYKFIYQIIDSCVPSGKQYTPGG